MKIKNNIAFFSIRRPIFIASITILVIVIGSIAFKRMGVDLFPETDPSSIQINVSYPGASPEEIEKLITRPIEDAVSSIAGLKKLTSQSYEGISVISAEFTLETDIKYAEQQIRDKMTSARPDLPSDIKEPVYQKRDLSSMPILRLSLQSDLPPTQAYDLANESIKLQLQQVNNVGDVEINGGRRREIQVELDRDKLNAYRISASTVANQLASSGINVPAGSFDKGSTQTVFRSVGEFEDLKAIGDSVVQFSGDIANAVTVKSLGKIVDSAEDAKTIGLLYYPYRTVPIEKPGLIARITGATTKDVPITDAKVRPALFLDVFKQSGSNTVAVADGIKEKVKKINESLKNTEGSPRLEIMSDYSKSIKDNVDDVTVTIIFGIILAVITVYMFLGNIRSTIITGIAIPTSLFGAFILMYVAGFTINLMSLMALSLAVGLLIDDAIVIQENIYRKREAKMHPFEAAEFGTEEVKLAVIATTLVVISVFMPISFLSGSIGAFFKPFGFSVVFAMAISLLAALTIAPLLNAYFGGTGHKNNNLLVRGFDRLQDKVDGAYEKIITFTLANPVKILVATALIFVSSLVMVFFVPKTFQPENDSGQFNLNIELAAGTSLEGTRAVTDQIIPKLQKIKEIKYFSLVIGNQRGETNKATFGIMCVPRSERKVDTNGLKQLVRKQITEFKFANPSVTNAFGGGGGGKPFSLNISGDNLDELDEYSKRVIDILQKVPAFRKKTPAFTEISSNYKPGTPEFQVKLDPMKMEMIGVQPRSVGNELRTYIAGTAVAKLHENGLQYDIRVRLNPYQRNLRTNYPFIRVPNTQNKMIPLNAISTTKEVIGPSLIMRQDRARIIQVSANLVPGEAIGNAGAAAMQLISKEPKPKGVSIKLVGQSEDYADLMKSFAIAFGLSILFIFLVLASLYDSFITPATILMALPPALTGAFAALFFTGRMFDMFSLIGIITLLGLVTKNSILLVDFALEGIRAGMSQKEAIKRAGLVRLRPILMTSFAIIAGMLPLALGVGEAAAYRKSMGVAIIGGVIFSTFLTLLVVPAIFEFIDRFRAFIERLFLSDEIICATKEISCGDSKELVGDIPSHAEQVAKKAANGVKGKNKSKPKRPSK